MSKVTWTHIARVVYTAYMSDQRIYLYAEAGDDWRAVIEPVGSEPLSALGPNGEYPLLGEPKEVLQVVYDYLAGQPRTNAAGNQRPPAQRAIAEVLGIPQQKISYLLRAGTVVGPAYWHGLVRSYFQLFVIPSDQVPVPA